MNLRADIQGLRALAVILVIIFHINEKWLPGGFIGVDVFFVISGFLISKSIIQQKDEGKFNIIRFFEGRLKRILPAYYFALIFILIVAVFLFIPSDFLTLFHQTKRMLVFLSNQLFAQTENYFGAKSFENPLLHTWSLSIEMQFYLLMPILIIIIPKKYRLSFILIIFITLLAFTQYGLSVLDKKNQIYFSLPARSLEFIIGILLNFTISSTLFPKKLVNIISTCGLFLIMCSAFLLDKNSCFPGLLSLPACIGTALIIWASNGSVNTFFSNPTLVRIGDYSYSLYLWHWPILAFFRYYTMNYDLNSLNVILAVLVFISLSVISFHFVEEPIRKKKSWKLYFPIILLIFFIGLVWFFGKQYNENQLKDVTEFITPKSDSNHHQYQGYKLFGDTSIPDQRILIIGDSHCQSMLPFFNKIGKENNLNFHSISMNLYPPISGFDIERLSRPIDKTTYQKLSKISDNLIQKAKIIIIVKFWPDISEYKKAYETLYTKLNSDQQLVFLSDYPHLQYNPVRQYKSINKPDNLMVNKLTYSIFNDELLTFAKDKKNVHLFDLYTQFDFSNAPFYNDTLMYYDESHLNVYGSEKIAEKEGKVFCERIKKFIK